MPPAVDDEDAVRVRCRRQIVGHHDGRTARHQPAQRLHHAAGGERVETGRGLVEYEYEDGGAAQHG
ncbi:hypothetical protein H1D24_16260 [Streptomyces sp. PSKA28]|uniref:Uncharacterized protein n=1 Tax=Streptomyces himalayensis subsp. himalayensis TaxID=2756131 RepID=A0A7W0DLH1_9ACTN|nr:hypothetical protein [Streptomyces himalayensis subsp. himalayensis]